MDQWLSRLANLAIVVVAAMVLYGYVKPAPAQSGSATEFHKGQFCPRRSCNWTARR